MKVFIVLAAFVVAVSAGRPGYGPGPIGAVSTGTSSQFRSEDNYGNYNFGYDESHATGGTSRREEQVNGVRRGSYSLNDADGRRRLVNYVADAAGFRATIQTNEPGVEPKDPADVLLNKAGPVAIAAPVLAAPAPVYAAPAPLPAPVLPAPVFAPAPAYGPGPVGPAPFAAPVKGYLAPRAPLLSGPAYGPAPAIIEPETPRAFSYSFGSTHLAPAAYAPAPVYAAPAPLPAPIPAPLPAPVYQQQVEAY